MEHVEFYSKNKFEKLVHLFGFHYKNISRCTVLCGPGSSVGIGTGYGLDGPGSNPGGGRDFRTFPNWPWCPPSLLYNGYRVFSGCKERAGRDADPSSPSNAVVMKE